MRILFLVHNLGKTRHFERVIRGLTSRGHTVLIAAARKKKPLKPTKTLHDDPRIEVLPCPVRRVDGWQDVAVAIRRARDYVRFLDPRYAHSDKLAARAAGYAPPRWSAAFDERPWLRRHWRALQRGLALAEDLLPSERYFELYLTAEQPDILLVTPLVDFGSYQTDYVKAAHRIGLPVAFLPFSWDNLTNRGSIRVAPDRVIVWNERQRREAVELHGVPPDRVVVAGAPRFDDFFEMQPSTDRDGFCRPLGLDPARPIVLYTCSSNFVAPREVEFVRAWIGALRQAADPVARDCSVLVRPHPAHGEQWQGVTLSDLPGTVVWSDRATMQADQGLYDSLFHSAAVFGLNTSAMIEAAIVSRPVFTVTAPDFAGGQIGTLHFQYLRAENGGPVIVAGSFDEHLRQLAAGMSDTEGVAERSRRFVESFVRPRGLGTPAAGVMVDEIERVAALRKRRRGSPLWHHPARLALRAVARAQPKR